MKILADIAAGDYSQQDAAILSLSGSTVVDTLQRVKVRHVGEGAVAAINLAGETVFDQTRQTLGLVSDNNTKARPALLSEFSTDAVAALRRLDIEPNFGTRRPNPNDPSCSDRR